MDIATNPLLHALGGEHDLPDFDAIDPSHVLPAVRAIVAESRAWIDDRVRRGAPYTWADTIAPLEDLDDRLSRVWGPVSHLHGVLDSKALREAYNAVLPELTDFETELGQHRDLYRAYRETLEQEPGLDDAQRALLEQAVRDFRLSGVALEGDARSRYREIAREQARLSARFEEHLLDAEQAWQLHCEDLSRLRGVPEQALARAATEAVKRGLSGWVFTLDHPAFDAIISHCADRALRRTLFEAWVTRASDRGPVADRYDNAEVMAQTLALRHEEARLLGFADYAALSLVPKMAASPDQVEAFLIDLAERAKPHAIEELKAVRRHAAEAGCADELAPWDLAYWSERLRESETGMREEELRPYFPLDAVLDGLFAITAALYGVTVREAAPPARPWHPDVRYFELQETAGETLGGFYLDAYARPGKRGGAWMDECLCRNRSATGLRMPIAYLVCNFAPAQGAAPSLLNHEEVLTLFHEFGHGLHHLLTEVDLPGVGGINGVAWDAVELPSQFMENFAWTREGFERVSRHVDTGEPLPPALHERLLRTRHFQGGWAMLRQVELALFDLRLHRDYDPDQGARIAETLAEVRELTGLVPQPEFERFAHSFAHIFAGGYAAGYYSYKWAEVLSSDAFGAFEESAVLDPDTGRRFREAVLAVGGTVEPAEMFRNFRGREPDPAALLRHSGLTSEPGGQTPAAGGAPA
jgi:oligopeptidase A